MDDWHVMWTDISSTPLMRKASPTFMVVCIIGIIDIIINIIIYRLDSYSNIIACILIISL
jgi:hypothetical protein